MRDPATRRALLPRRAREGVAAMEFALWFIPIVVLLSGIIEISRVLSMQHTVSRAARDGARIGAGVITSPTGSGPVTESDIESAAIDHALQVLADVGLPCTGGCVVSAEWFANPSDRWMLTVHVEHPFTPLIGLIEAFDRPVSRNFTMMTQYQP